LELKDRLSITKLRIGWLCSIGAKKMDKETRMMWYRHRATPKHYPEKQEVPTTFYMIFGGYGTPHVKHPTYEAAEVETKRLARRHPDKEFFILSAVASVKTGVNPVKVVKFS
jgi:hypothetical protein